MIGFEYRNTAGAKTGMKLRRSMSGERRFFWDKGSTQTLYGLWRPIDASKSTILCEGESDALTLWSEGFQALGLPGASSWQEKWIADLPATGDLYVIVEPDKGGEATTAWVRKSKVRDRIKLVRMPQETKDPSALYLKDRENFARTFGEMLATAQPIEAEKTESRVKAVELAEFLALKLPEREMLLAPIIPKQGLVMIHGARGLGKTYVSLNIAYCVASGGEFLKWKSPAPAGVLFVDGEMPAKVLQERFDQIVIANEREAAAPIRIITPDLNILHGLPNLSTPEGQAAIDAHVDDSIHLIIVDNLSSLARSGVENDAESWLPMQTWALRHRAAGRSVLFIHHSGKGGAQRGTSRREDVLDTVINLRRPSEYGPEQGAHFEVHVEKARGFHGDDAKPFDAKLTTDRDGKLAWTVSDLDDTRADRVIKLHNDGMRPYDIASELGISRATVYRQLQSADTLGKPQRKSGKESVVRFRVRNDQE